MINLLPPEHASNIRYGRYNAKLVHWITISLLATLGLLIILMIGWVYINQQVSSLNKDVAASKAELTAQNLTQVQKQADEITNKFDFLNLLSKLVQLCPRGLFLIR
jgi:hypothetical protein